MPRALFASPFRDKLDLSVDEREHLHATANMLVDEAQTLYEQFLWSDHSIIDDGQWSLLKSKEDLCVYQDRRPGAGTGSANMHLLLMVGTVLGTLNDAMYGVLSHTTNDMRLKTAYVQDTLLDSAVLETLLSPTVDDPFQSLTMRWFVKGVPLHVRLIAKHYDNVYLESTGMKRLRNGEQVGFHLMHSIMFPKTPRLPMFERFNMSICTLWRQRSADHVEAFMTSYTELPDTFAVPMILKSTADALLSLWKMIHCAQMKKLTHLVRQKRTGIVEQNATAQVAGCAVCSANTRSVRRGTKSACAVCAKAVCTKCHIKHELAFFAPDDTLLKQAMRFCIPCLAVARRLDAAIVAAAEAPTKPTHTRITRPQGHSHRLWIGSSAYGAPTASSTSSVFSEDNFTFHSEATD